MFLWVRIWIWDAKPTLFSQRKTIILEPVGGRRQGEGGRRWCEICLCWEGVGLAPKHTVVSFVALGDFLRDFPSLPPSTLCSWVSLGSRKVGVFRALMY